MNEANAKKSLLWVLPKYPLPPHDGARHATSILLRNLKDFNIDLLIFESRPEEFDCESLKTELGVRNVFLFKRSSISSSYIVRILSGINKLISIPNLPITFQPYTSPQIESSFEALFHGKVLDLKKNGVIGDLSALPLKWDGIVYDGLHGSAHLFDGKRSVVPEEYPPVFYRAHNVESNLWKEKHAREKKGIRKDLFRWQAPLVYEYELAFLRKAQLTFPVSENDLEKLKSKLPRIEGVSVPIGYTFPTEPPKRSPNVGHFIFVGQLDWPPNREGLQWFFNEVWPEVSERNSALTIDIIGKGDGRYLSRYRKLRGVSLLGYVDSLEEHYAKAQASIVPLAYGSGARVKVIEAASYGCPVVSSAIGVQGLNLLSDVSYLQAEGLADWITRLTKTDEQQFEQVSLGAFQTLSQHCDPKRAAELFTSSLLTSLKC